MASIKWICVLLAIGLWPSQALLADLIVDDFLTAESRNNSGGYGSTTGPSPGSSIFGGIRDTNLQVVLGNATQQWSIASHVLNLSVTGVGAFETTMRLTYNDATPSEDLGAAGLQSVLLKDVATTAPWRLTMSFTGTNSVTPATRTVNIPSGYSNDLIIPFSGFSSSVTGLGNISQISLFFLNDSGAAPQLSFGPVSLISAVPEPTWIGALSIIGVWLGRRRMRRSARRKP